MTDSLSHRGPDGAGYEYYRHGNVSIGLGHRRLSIIDLSEQAAQPMRRGDYSIILNGEIYNYREVKDGLQTRPARRQVGLLFFASFALLTWKGWVHPNQAIGFLILGVVAVFFINIAGAGHNALNNRTSNVLIGVACALAQYRPKSFY